MNFFRWEIEKKVIKKKRERERLTEEGDTKRRKDR